MIDPRLILAQLLKAREIKVEVGRMTFTAVRPTEMELIRMRDGGGMVEVGMEMVQNKVTGWDGVLESDIVSGGASDPMPFDTSLYRQWIADRADLWPPLCEAFAKAIEEHKAKMVAVQGN